MAGEVCVGIGEILWDEFSESGKTVRHLGGAPCNFAFHARALGARGEIISAIGEDELGYAIAGKLAQAGFDPLLLTTTASHPTGRVTVEHQRNKPPRYTIHENVAWDHLIITEPAKTLCQAADALCFGSLAQRSPVTLKSLRHLAAHTPPEALRIFDVNLRQNYFTAEILEASFTLANIAKISDDELPKVARLLHLPKDFSGFAKNLFRRHPLRLIAITRGRNGSLLVTPDMVEEHPGIPADVVDSVGAGDSFTACLAVGLLRTLPLSRINDAANRVAAHVCSQPGATPALPPDLVRLLED
jgi:fructokinase